MHRHAALTICVCFFLAGCKSTEPEDDFVTVHVDALATIYVVGDRGVQAPFSEGELVFTVTKAGGEFESIAGNTDASGRMGPLRTTFKVYREQPVVLSLRLLGGFLPPQFGGGVCDPAEWLISRVGGDDSRTLYWRQIEDKMGEEFYWMPSVQWYVMQVP